MMNNRKVENKVLELAATVQSKLRKIRIIKGEHPGLRNLHPADGSGIVKALLEGDIEIYQAISLIDDLKTRSGSA